MRAYYEFIFTVAENTDKMAKVVYDYTTKVEQAMDEAYKDSQSTGNKLGKRNKWIENAQGVKKDRAQIRNQN